MPNVHFWHEREATNLARHAHLDHPVEAHLLSRAHEIGQKDVGHRAP
jgi:hypothetical protein